MRDANEEHKIKFKKHVWLNYWRVPWKLCAAWKGTGA